MPRATTTLCFGAAGSGKTYIMCAKELVESWCIPGRTGAFWSNFPVNHAGLFAAITNRWGLERAPAIIATVHTLPTETTQSWRTNQGQKTNPTDDGPWNFFDTVDLHDALICLDEVHEFCHAGSPERHRVKWGIWLGQVRHRGAEGIILCTQAPMKLPKQIRDECGEEIRIIDMRDQHDPWLGTPFGDWRELIAGYTGTYSALSMVEHYQPGRYRPKLTSRAATLIHPRLFPVYDSYSKPLDAINKASALTREYQRRSRLSLTLWFITRNLLPLTVRAILATTIIYLTIGGGLVAGIQYTINRGHKPKTATTAPTTTNLPLHTQPLPPQTTPLPTPTIVALLPDRVRTADGQWITIGQTHPILGTLIDVNPNLRQARFTNQTLFLTRPKATNK